MPKQRGQAAARRRPRPKAGRARGLVRPAARPQPPLCEPFTILARAGKGAWAGHVPGACRRHGQDGQGRPMPPSSCWRGPRRNREQALKTRQAGIRACGPPGASARRARTGRGPGLPARPVAGLAQWLPRTRKKVKARRRRGVVSADRCGGSAGLTGRARGTCMGHEHSRQTPRTCFPFNPVAAHGRRWGTCQADRAEKTERLGPEERDCGTRVVPASCAAVQKSLAPTAQQGS